MPRLDELYVATRTRNTEDAETEDLPVLVVKREANIVFTRPLFGGDSMMAAIVPGTLADSNGLRPEPSSKRMMPSEKMSVR